MRRVWSVRLKRVLRPERGCGPGFRQRGQRDAHAQPVAGGGVEELDGAAVLVGDALDDREAEAAAAGGGALAAVEAVEDPGAFRGRDARARILHLEDRAGVLARIAYVLAKANINVVSAKINTLGERAEDVFLIDGARLHDEQALLRLETSLYEQLVV